MIVCTFKHWVSGNLYCDGGYQEVTKVFHSKEELEEEIKTHEIIVVGIWKLDSSGACGTWQKIWEKKVKGKSIKTLQSRFNEWAFNMDIKNDTGSEYSSQFMCEVVEL